MSCCCFGKSKNSYTVNDNDINRNKRKEQNNSEQISVVRKSVLPDERVSGVSGVSVDVATLPIRGSHLENKEVDRLSNLEQPESRRQEEIVMTQHEVDLPDDYEYAGASHQHHDDVEYERNSDQSREDFERENVGEHSENFIEPPGGDWNVVEDGEVDESDEQVTASEGHQRFVEVDLQDDVVSLEDSEAGTWAAGLNHGHQI